MDKQPPVDKRPLRTVKLHSDLVVVGGGLAGTCGAITAARAGAKVVLIQDRPVLGGNASSEVRLWVLGATSHMNNNNRYAREGGVIDEILVENMYRNPEGNPLIVDTIVLEKVVNEPNITLLLNTAVHDAEKSDPDTIRSVRAFCSQNSTAYEVSAPLFFDASGDGILGFLTGAAFRMGAESIDEFGERFAPSREYGELLGHSIYFYTKDTGKPVRFVPPSYALDDVPGRIPRFRAFNASTHGCKLWWIEYGGRLDTVHEAETIKWELWKVVYGVWNYIKNSGQFPDAQNLTLEWVGTIAGKRESRRFEGDTMLIQQDLIEQRRHDDAVAFGGWSIDLHPADGVFSERPGCNQWHAKGVFQIPYRALYSRNISNLFIGGRLISASHVAFGSTRVMGTGAHCGQAVGMAAVLCARESLRPRDLASGKHLRALQLALQRTGQHIPHVVLPDPDDLTTQARLSASSEFRLAQLPGAEHTLRLDRPAGQWLPLPAGRVPTFSLQLEAARNAVATVELRTDTREGNFAADVLLASREIRLDAGPMRSVNIDFGDVAMPRAGYALLALRADEHVSIRLSDLRVTGLVSVRNVSGQHPPTDVGVDEQEFWRPERRPAGQNLAVSVQPAVALFSAGNVTNGITRPTTAPNAWVADPADTRPTLTLEWSSARRIREISLAFDTDFDHAMESVLWGHPERTMPLCVKHYRILDDQGRLLHETLDNHQTRNRIRLATPAQTTRLQIEVLATHGAPAAVFEVRCYA